MVWKCEGDDPPAVGRASLAPPAGGAGNAAFLMNSGARDSEL